jgi:hypothetical protein
MVAPQPIRSHYAARPAVGDSGADATVGAVGRVITKANPATAISFMALAHTNHGHAVWSDSARNPRRRSASAGRTADVTG